MIVTTETGSVYHLGMASHTWTRLTKTDSSGSLRRESGLFEEIWPLEIGEPVRMLCPAYTIDAPGRWVITSPIVKMEEDHAAASRKEMV